MEVGAAKGSRMAKDLKGAPVGSPILGVWRWDHEEDRGERFVLGFGGGLGCAASALTKTAPPAGRAGPLLVNRRDPGTGAASWRVCAAAGE